MKTKNFFGLLIAMSFLLSAGCSNSSSSGGNPAPVSEQPENENQKPSLPDLEFPSDETYENAKQNFVAAVEPFLTYCEVKGGDTFEKVSNFKECQLKPYPQSKQHVSEIEAQVVPAAQTFIATQSERRKGAAGSVFGPKTDEQEATQKFLDVLQPLLNTQKEKNDYADIHYPKVQPKAQKILGEIAKTLTSIGCKKNEKTKFWNCPNYQSEEVKKMTLSEVRRHQNAYYKANQLVKELYALFDGWVTWNVDLIAEASMVTESTDFFISTNRSFATERVEAETWLIFKQIQSIFGKGIVEASDLFRYPGVSAFENDDKGPITEADVKAMEAHLEKLRELARFMGAHKAEIEARAFDVLYVGYEYNFEEGRVYSAKAYDQYPQVKALSAEFNLNFSEEKWLQTIEKMDLLKGNQLWAERQENYAQLEALFATLSALKNAEQMPIRLYGTVDLIQNEGLREIDSLDEMIRIISHPRFSTRKTSLVRDLSGIEELLDARATLIKRAQASGADVKKAIEIYYYVSKDLIPPSTESAQTIQAIDFGDVADILLYGE